MFRTIVKPPRGRMSPSPEVTRSLWIQFVKRHRRDFEVSATSVLCSAHFEPSCFTQDLEIAGICGIKRKLTSGAVPTIDIAGLPKQTAPATTDWERRRLIRELLQPATQEQTGQNRTQDIRLTVKEEDHQEKNLGHGGTAANHVKKEPLDELEEDLVNCCNKTAQLLGDKCGTAGTDAVVENEQSMDFDNCHNTGTSSQQSCTVGTVEEQQETNPGMSYNQIVDTVEGELEVNSGNCYNTNTPSQLRCSIGPGGIQVKKEGGQEMNFGSCYNTVTVTSQLSSITVVTSQPSSSTFVTSQPGSSPVVTSQPSCSTVVTTQLSSSTVSPQLSSSSVVTSQPGSSPVVTSQPSSRTVVTPQLSSSAVLIPQLSSRIVIIPQLSSSTVFIPQLSSSTVFIPQLSSSTVIIPQLSSSTVIPQLSSSTVVTPQLRSSTVVTPQLRSSTVVMPQPSSSTVVTPQLSSSTVVTSQLSSSTVVTPQLSSSTVVTSQLSSSTVVTPQLSSSTVVMPQPSSSTVVMPQPSFSTVVMPQPSFSTVVTPQLSFSTVVTPQPSSSTVVTPQLSSSTVGDSVKLESVQKVDLSNCYTTSTSSQLCSDMVGITQKHNSETNIGSSTPDQQSLNTNRSKVEETPRFDLTYPLVQSYCAYWPPGAIKRAMKEAAEIPQACVDPAESRWHVNSYEMEECVPEQVDYMGTGHAASDNNQDSNYVAVNPGLPKHKQLIRQVLELRKEDSLEMDNGNSNVTDSTSPQLIDELTDGEDNLSDISNITDMKDVLENGNDSEESDKEVSSSVSENEKRGHKSDSSRHMSSEEEELSGDDSDDSVSSSGSDWLEEIQRQNQLKRKRQRQRNKGKKKTSWVCKCQEKFTGKSSYEEHKREAHPVTCVYCEEKFTSTQALRKHLKTHMSSEDKLDLKGNKLFMCDHCGLFFTSTKLKRHELQISTARPYKCEVENCKATYKTKSAVRCHFITVHNRDRFPCPYEGCKKTYGDKSRMMKHYKVHTNERRYQCSYCGKMFQRGEHLRVHTRIHTGDTPFNCTLCNYSGRQYNSLRSHMKVHHPEHCVKSGDEKGIKPSKKPRKKAVIDKDSLADKGPGSAKKTTPYSTRSQSYRAK